MLNRTSRTVMLTAEGRILYDAVVTGFGEIERAVSKLHEAQRPATLTLSSTITFLGSWLLPRLPAINRLLPDTNLRLHAADEIVELRSGYVDMAIRYGEASSRGSHSTPLTADVFAPVCSPGLGLKSKDGLRCAALIHVDGLTRPQPAPDWERWCQKAHVSAIDTASGLRLSNSMLALQLAIAGQGVAIVSLTLAADALADGLLVRPFAETLPGDTFSFVSAPDIVGRDAVMKMKRWFQANLTANA
jgi:LysR family transcriptional regulator, glycine cleavage system transcriptional activator